MSDESLGTAVVAPPSAPSVPTADEPEAPPVETGEAQVDEQPDALPTEEDYESILERISQNEDWKREHEERLETIRKEGHDAAQKRLHPLYEKASRNTQTLAQNSQLALENLNSLLGVFQKIEQNGVTEPGEIAAAIAKYGQDFGRVIGGLQANQGWYDGTHWLVHQMGEHFGVPATDIREQLKQAQLTGADESELKMLASQYFDSVVAEREKKAEDRGYRKGLKESTNAQSRAAEAKANQGQGPDTARGAGGAIKKYTDMTTEERAKLSPEERDRLIARDYGG